MPHHLLLADDSVTIQRVIKLTFADEDVDVVTVGDGDQAVAAIDKAPPDIVLADVAMPGRTGYDVAQHIRQTPRLSHIPVVLLTGAFEPVDEARASKVGCDAVLAKPFEPEVVVTRVRELLARPRSNAAPTAERSAAPVAAPAAPPSAPVAPVPVAVIPSASEPSPAASPAPVVPVSGGLAGTSAPAIEPSTLTWASAAPATAPALGSAPPAIPVPPASIEEPLAAASSPLPGLSALAGARPTPAPAKRSPAEVDAYFDRLDEAFATLATAPRPAPVPVPEARAVPPLSLVPPAAPRTPVAPVEPAPAASLAAAFEGLLAPGSASSGPVGPPATPAVEHLPVPPSSPTGETTTVITTTPAAASPTDAAREGGLTDAQVTELADRVLEQLTARLGAKTLPQIVAEVAERLVRAEIDQIKRRV